MNGNPFTPTEIERIKALYPDTRTDVIATKLGRPTHSIYGIANRLGLKKSADFLASADSGRLTKLTQAGVAHRFKPGQTPMNKGKKQSDYMTADAIARTAATRFQKGITPHNTIDEIGTITVRKRKNRNDPPYQYIKLATGMKPLHHHIWEQEHGPIPDGYIVRFIDGNTLNCVVENLKLITRAEHAILNTIHRYPDEVKQVIRLNSKLKKLITNKKTKQQQ